MQFDDKETLGNVNHLNNDIAKKSIDIILEKLNKDTPGTTPGDTTFHSEDEEQVKDEASKPIETKDKEDNKRKYTDEEIKAFKEKKNKNYRYFKVTEKFLSIETTKSETWVYLTHCRSLGYRFKVTDEEDQKTNVSIASLNAVQNYFDDSIDKDTYEIVLKSLERKGLIKVHEADKDEKLGFFKTDKKIEIVKDDEDRFIPLPRELMSPGNGKANSFFNVFKKMTNKEIKLVIKQYANLNSKDWFSVDKNYFSLEMKKDKSLGTPFKFGDGYNRFIYKKTGLKLFTPFDNLNSFQKNFKDINFDDLNTLLETGLFKLSPILYSVDEEDPLLKKPLGEIYNFKNGYLVYIPVDLNYEILWLLRPIYPVRTKQYEAFDRIESEHYNRQFMIYYQPDESTKIKYKSSFLYNEDFINYLFNYLKLPPKTGYFENFKDLNAYSKYLGDKLDYLYSLGNKEDIGLQIEYLESNKEKEKEEISLKNKKKFTRTGKRSRQTTNTALKSMENKINQLEDKLKNIEQTERQIILQIPQYYFDNYEDEFACSWNDFY